MSLLICTDLDRTLIPNGPQSEPKGARAAFARLARSPQVCLAYVSGRHRALVEKAMEHYQLPEPDFVIGDVGTTIYHVGPGREWAHQSGWDEEISSDWGGHTHAELKSLLQGIGTLRPQEHSKQNRHKLSYYVPAKIDQGSLDTTIISRLQSLGIKCNLVWSLDEPRGIGLLDILPASASKCHAIDWLMGDQEFDTSNTVFCGDSGNDMEVLASQIPAVLVANAEAEVKQQASELAAAAGNTDTLYIAQGGFAGMNGNYSGGMLEGIAHYHPDCVALMGLESQ